MALTEMLIMSSTITTFRDVVTSPVIAFILLALFFIGIVLQVFSTNINLFGVVAFTSIIIFYAGHLLTDGHNISGLFLFGLGALLIMLEFFILGTFLGVLGMFMILISILLVSGNILLYSIFLLFILIIAIILWVILVKKNNKRRLPFFSRLILSDSTDKESGYTSFDDRSELLGKIAKTITPLRPSGTIRLDDRRIDAVAEGSYIAGNVEVKIIFVEGTRIVVRPVEE
ncbi:NfeD family protein [Corticicoccus populi]|uniref:NfeD family protein n=1 Tax=Corticicoccus populi TaxID=1812821 RepID=A0ABW5WRS9_9STAP